MGEIVQPQKSQRGWESKCIKRRTVKRKKDISSISEIFKIYMWQKYYLHFQAKGINDNSNRQKQLNVNEKTAKAANKSLQPSRCRGVYFEFMGFENTPCYLNVFCLMPAISWGRRYAE